MIQTLSARADIHSMAPDIVLRPMFRRDPGGLPGRLRSDICRILNMYCRESTFYEVG